MAPIRFTPPQHAELLQLGLAPEAIDRIEVDALPSASAVLEQGPRHSDVRGELVKLERALDKARSAIERLLNATEAVPHLKAARSRISGGGHRYAAGGMRLDETSKSLATAIDVVSRAVARVPTEANRHRTASAFPIEQIHRALQFGSVIAGVEPLSLMPSISPTSPFRRMVGICYEAIGAPNDDPEQAIKEYLRQWSALQDHIRNSGLGTEHL